MIPVSPWWGRAEPSEGRTGSVKKNPAPRSKTLSFLFPCPNCGPRSVYEFQFGGEYHRRPNGNAPREAWTRYLYLKTNSAGNQTEWWYHRMGCRQWFLAVRNTSTNQVVEAFWPEELKVSPTAPEEAAPLPSETSG